MFRLLKFGKREHLEQLAKGDLFFSPLEKFKILEIETSNKGRGDRNEGRYVIKKPKNIRLYKLKEDGSYESNPSFVIEKLDELPINLPVLNNLPVLCFTKLENRNNIKNKIIDKTMLKKFMKDFDDIDSVLVIKNPTQFLDNINTNLSVDVFHSEVFYEEKETIQFNDFVNIGTVSNVIGKKYTVDTLNVHKIAFRKDVYYEYQQEFRIVLPSEKIKDSKIYKFKPIDEFQIISLIDLQ